MRRIPVHAGVHESASQRETGQVAFQTGTRTWLDGKRSVTVPAHREVVAVLLQPCLALHPQTEVEHQVRRDSPIVMHEGSEVIEVHIRWTGESRCTAVRNADQQVGQRAARTRVRIRGIRPLGELLGEVQGKAVSEVHRVQGQPPPLPAELQGVSPDVLGVRPAYFAGAPLHVVDAL